MGRTEGPCGPQRHKRGDPLCGGFATGHCDTLTLVRLLLPFSSLTASPSKTVAPGRD